MHTVRVSYNGITSAFQADDRGSIPLTRSKKQKNDPWGRFLFSRNWSKGNRTPERGGAMLNHGISIDFSVYPCYYEPQNKVCYKALQNAFL